MPCALYYKCVTQKSVPKSRWVLSYSKGLFFKMFDVNVSNKRADWRSHGCPLHLFVVLALKEKICPVKGEHQEFYDMLCFMFFPLL